MLNWMMCPLFCRFSTVFKSEVVVVVDPDRKISRVPVISIVFYWLAVQCSWSVQSRSLPLFSTPQDMM